MTGTARNINHISAPLPSVYTHGKGWRPAAEYWSEALNYEPKHTYIPAVMHADPTMRHHLLPDPVPGQFDDAEEDEGEGE